MKYLEYFIFFIIAIYNLYNIPNDKFEDDSYSQSEFKISSSPPLPGVYNYIISDRTANYIIKSLLLLSNQLSLNLSSMIFTIQNFNPSLASIFAVYATFNDNVLYQSIYLGLSLVSDLSCIFLILILLILHSKRLFCDLMKKENNVFRTLFWYIMRFCCIIAFTVLIYVGTFTIDYDLRTHITNYDDISLEFGASFENSRLQPTHLEVKDGSLVSIINKHHKKFLGVTGKTVSGTNQLDSENVWRIVKVAEDGDVIKNNDQVRLINMKTNKVLALNKVNSTDKFFDLELSQKSAVVDSKNDIFRIICENSLISRTTPFEIVNDNTGLFLGMRKLNKTNVNVYASIYSNKKHRIFYISDNDINDNSEKVQLTYPKMSLKDRLIEHTKLIIEKRPTFVRDTLHSRIFLIILPLFAIFAIFNIILESRGFMHKEIDPLMFVFYFNTICLKFIYCGDENYLAVCEVITNYMFFKDLSRLMVYIYLSVGIISLVTK